MPFSPAISAPHWVGLQKSHHASSDMHAYLKAPFDAATHIVGKGNDLLSISLGADHPAGGSGIAVETGRPTSVNVEGDGENPNSDIDHDGLSDTVAPFQHDVIGSRIDDTLLMSKPKVSLDCCLFLYHIPYCPSMLI